MNHNITDFELHWKLLPNKSVSETNRQTDYQTDGQTELETETSKKNVSNMELI